MILKSELPVFSNIYIKSGQDRIDKLFSDL